MMRATLHDLYGTVVRPSVCFSITLTVCFILNSCTKDEQLAQNIDTSTIDLEASNTVWNTDITFTDSSITKARVHADRGRLYGSRQETVLDSHVVVRFFSPKGSELAQLHCQRVRIDNRTNAMFASGNVVIESNVNGTKVESASMMWDNKSRKLTSQEYVKVTRPGEIIEGGIGFESDESMSNYRIFKVKGVKQ